MSSLSCSWNLSCCNFSLIQRNLAILSKFPPRIRDDSLGTTSPLMSKLLRKVVSTSWKKWSSHLSWNSTRQSRRSSLFWLQEPQGGVAIPQGCRSPNRWQVHLMQNKSEIKTNYANSHYYAKHIKNNQRVLLNFWWRALDYLPKIPLD